MSLCIKIKNMSVLYGIFNGLCFRYNHENKNNIDFLQVICFSIEIVTERIELMVLEKADFNYREESQNIAFFGKL